MYNSTNAMINIIDRKNKKIYYKYRKKCMYIICYIVTLLFITMLWNVSLIDCPVINERHTTYEGLNSKVKF